MHNEDQLSRLFDLSESGKRFSQLTADEQNLVIEVMGAAEEYDAMVAMQPQIEKTFAAEPELEPDKEMRRAVLGGVQRTPRIWLNSFWLMIWPAEMPVYRRPGFQFASVAALVAMVWVAVNFNPTKDDAQMALNESKDSSRKEAETEKKEESQENQVEAFAAEESLEQETVHAPETSVTTTLNDVADNRHVALGESPTPPVEVTGIVFSGATAPAKAEYFAKTDQDVADDELAAASEYKSAARKDKATEMSEDRKMAKEDAPGSSTRASVKTVPTTVELIDLLYTAY